MAINGKQASFALLPMFFASIAIPAPRGELAAQELAEMAAGDASKRIAIIDDIPYRSGDSEAWRLDLAMPENFGQELRPALVIIHGGGWSGGSKQTRPYRSMLLDYALKGYVTLSIDYRLTGEAPMPAGMLDVDCAIRWLRAHADEYRVDPDRIGAYGHSAGAHLAVMLGASPPAPPIESDCEWSEYSSELTSVAGGATPTVLPDRFDEAERYSPATWVSSEMIPLLLIQGTDDNIVSVESVDDYVAALEAAGAPDVTYLRVDGANHGVAYEHYLERSMAAIAEFFGRTLGNP
jgi:acetyl esterase/lipase